MQVLFFLDECLATLGLMSFDKLWKLSKTAINFLANVGIIVNDEKPIWYPCNDELGCE